MQTFATYFPSFTLANKQKQSIKSWNNFVNKITQSEDPKHPSTGYIMLLNYANMATPEDTKQEIINHYNQLKNIPWNFN